MTWNLLRLNTALGLALVLLLALYAWRVCKKPVRLGWI